MKHFFLFTFLILTTFLSYSQSKNRLLIFSQPETIPAQYIINPEDEIKSYFDLNPENVKDDVIVNYITDLKFYKKELLESYNIEKNQVVVEQFLNEILLNIIDDQTIKRLNLKIFISNEPEFNITSFEDGTIVFNLYNLIHLNSEAEIAFMLAHEVAHIMEKNNIDLNLFNAQQTISVITNNKESKKKHDFIENQIDETTKIFFNSSDYSLKKASKILGFFSKLDKRDHLNINKFKKSEVYLTAHQITKNRIEAFDTQILLDRGNDFIVDKLKFEKIREEALLYSLDNLFYLQKYDDCYALAFEFFMHSENRDLVFYILEPLRRLIYSRELSLTKGLLTDKFNLGLYSSIPKNVNEMFIADSKPNMIESIKNQELYTYQQYFNYFKNIVINENIQTCYLTLGLYNYHSSKDKDVEYLNKYLELGELKYRTYVEYLIKKEIKLNQNPYNSLLIFNELYILKNYQHGFPSRDVKEEDTLAPIIYLTMDSLYTRISKTPNSVISLDLIKTTQYKKYQELNRLFDYYKFLNSKNINLKSVDIYMLEPDLFNFIYDNKISRLDFYDFFTLKDVQRSKDILIRSVILSGNPSIGMGGAAVFFLVGAALNDKENYLVNYYSFKNSSKSLIHMNYSVNNHKNKNKLTLNLLRHTLITTFKYSKK